MFTSAEAFSQNLDKWDTSNVTTMNRMFQEAKAFNGDISTWDTKNVSDMAYMFSGATTFNKTYQAGMLIMFQQWKECLKSIEFNSPIFKLVSPKVKNMQYMFYTQKFNNSNISDWNTSSVTDKINVRGATSLIKI
nr:BspA family leucine-rich repeat surface protein [Mycoplasmopsis bovis]